MFIPDEDYARILEVLPILCVDCVILHEGCFLLVRRDNEPAKGEYWFPGGRVYKGEQISAAAVRKAREEVSLACSFTKVVSVEETIFPGEDQGIASAIHTLSLDQLHSDSLWVNAEQARQLGLHPAVLSPLLACLQ